MEHFKNTHVLFLWSQRNNSRVSFRHIAVASPSALLSFHIPSKSAKVSIKQSQAIIRRLNKKLHLSIAQNMDLHHPGIHYHCRQYGATHNLHHSKWDQNQAFSFKLFSYLSKSWFRDKFFLNTCFFKQQGAKGILWAHIQFWRVAQAP